MRAKEIPEVHLLSIMFLLVLCLGDMDVVTEGILESILAYLLSAAISKKSREYKFFELLLLHKYYNKYLILILLCSEFYNINELKPLSTYF
jgi:hypothetical protein